MQTVNDNFFRNVDEKMLLLVLRDPVVRQRLLLETDAAYFADETARRVFGLAREVADPTEFNLIDAANGLRLDEPDKRAARELIGRVFASPVPTHSEAFAAGREWLVKAHWDFISTQPYDSKNVDKQLHLAALSGDDNTEIYFPESDPTKIIKELRGEEVAARFPFPDSLLSLNELTDGGMRRGETGLIIAGTGVGKSMWLCFLAASYAVAGHKVLYVNLEGKASYIWQRIGACVLNIDSKSLIELTDEEAAKHTPKLKSLPIMVRDVTGEATPADIRPVIERYKLLHGEAPDILIIDYMGELNPTRSSKNDNTYTNIGKIYKGLLDIARFNDLTVWSAMQVNREGVKESQKGATPTIVHIAESFQAAYKATLVLLLDLFHTNGDVGYLNLHTLKYRNKNLRPSMNVELSYPYTRFREMTGAEWMDVVSEKVKGGVEDTPPQGKVTVFGQMKEQAHKKQEAERLGTTLDSTGLFD